ncbi:MAG: hypothetical protein OJF50_001467 [Nitrospira sp.]|jgi:hypothetical protein|nr:hypothetical protein [Nitrospira sp.]
MIPKNIEIAGILLSYQSFLSHPNREVEQSVYFGQYFLRDDPS